MYRSIIDAADLLPHVGDADWIIVDCRYTLADVDAGIRAYETGHIPTATYAHLDHDLCGPPFTDQGRHPLPSPAAMSRLFCRLGINKEKQVVVYDDVGGAYAARLWWMLRYMGHTAVAVLNGGWQAWVAAAYPTRGGVETHPRALFIGATNHDWLIEMDDVPTAALLVDSRDPPRYRGEIEPIDPVAGHIPGAVNHPYAQNLDANGRFLPAAQIRAQLEQLLGEIPPAEAVYYCGSGVTACLNLVAQEYAGMEPGKLYVGSWSEWSRLKIGTGG
ncbi:MAG: sulfurtransferase [Anaerolineales bacterium]|nr:sulfurtransferase [Anaerolineales bacterium]MCB8951588.1 sulfurtransferase [Ardenticatenales bacterium]